MRLTPARLLAWIWIKLRRTRRTTYYAFILLSFIVVYLYTSAHSDTQAQEDEAPPWRDPREGGPPRPLPVAESYNSDAGGKVAAPHAWPQPDEDTHLESAMKEARRIVRDAELPAAAATPNKEEALSNKPQTQEEKEKEMALGYKNNGFNQWLSDRLSLHRELDDQRHERCLDNHYDVNSLPATSVVIVFHNEARTTLLRTVWSVLDRSPSQLVHEIILVDDASTMDHLKEPLEAEVKTIPKTHLYRLPSRSGLIRAKVFGAKKATGEVLTFLDSHCECTIGWLEPLMSRIKDDRRNVPTPTIDNVDKETFKYQAGKIVLTRGIFTWPLTFSWLDLPYEEAQKRDNPAAPLASPTMAGGLFSIERKYFFEIGSYDMGMDVWGGENLEMSFRIWMCGGRIEILPCSRVGHVFRLHHPYKFPNGTGDTINRNLNRVAEVWLDDYKEIYYHFRPHHRHLGTGDITERKALRQRLQCHSFKWYLDNVFPDMMVPVRENLHAHGNLRNAAMGRCLDSTSNSLPDMKPSLSPCTERSMSENQEFFFTKKLNEIRREANFGNRCLDFASGKPMDSPTFYGCHGMRGNQEWYHLPTRQLQHVPSKLCLQAHSQEASRYKLVMNTCDDRNENQKWTFSEYDQYHG